MNFNINELENAIKQIKAIKYPSMIVYCPAKIVEYLEEHWDSTVAKVEFIPFPYDDDKIYVMPVEEKPIKFVWEIDKNE